MMTCVHVCVACSLASVCPECSPGGCLPSVASVRYFPDFDCTVFVFNGDRLVELSFPGVFCCSV